MDRYYNYAAQEQVYYYVEPQRRARIIVSWFRNVKRLKNTWVKILLHSILTPIFLIVYGLGWYLKIILYTALFLVGCNLFVSR